MVEILLFHRGKAQWISELGSAEFTIEDNGIGMSPEFRKSLFDPFSRADDHRTTRVQGTGLGMAISRNIVNLMNGNIKVDSTLHKGTRITVTIYLELQEKKEKRTGQKSCESAGSGSG